MVPTKQDALLPLTFSWLISQFETAIDEMHA